jgi:hypothetical protein
MFSVFSFDSTLSAELVSKVQDLPHACRAAIPHHTQNFGAKISFPVLSTLSFNGAVKISNSVQILNFFSLPSTETLLFPHHAILTSKPLPCLQLAFTGRTSGRKLRTFSAANFTVCV